MKTKDPRMEDQREDFQTETEEEEEGDKMDV